MLVCVVGKSCSGKTYICELLKTYSSDIIHLDIDAIAHQILTLDFVCEQLKETFGTSIFNNTSVNRKVLSQIVFNSVEAMNKLTEITWPPMEALIDQFIEENSNKIILLDWQLLLKTKYYLQSDLKILINSPLEKRINKAILRDNITKETFLTREKASYNFEHKDFDYIIENDYSDKIKEKVKEIYDKSIVSR